MSERPLVLVTGSTDGIGLETARQLLRRGADVIVHGRSAARVAAALDELSRLAGRPVTQALLGDFSSLDSVRAMASQLAADAPGPTVLVNNAGVFCNERALSADGFERTMAVNHLAPFVLTHALLARPSCRITRVVNVSSMAHQRGRVDLDDVGLVKRRFDPYGMYAASKMANVLFTVELARRLASRGVVVNALHPGVVSTKLLTEGFGMRGGDTLEESAATSVMLALDAVFARVTGRYFSHGREAQPAAASRDAGLARAFYEATAKLVGVTPIG